MKIFAVLVIALALFTAACEDPAANKPRATTSEPTNATSSNTAVTAATPATKGEALALNPENSNVEFVGSKVTGKHDGGFEKFTGTIDLVNGKPEESSVSVDIDMASVVTDAAGLTDHLKTGDFFEVEKFPKSTFASTKIVADTAKGANAYTVTGDLEMRGVMKSITFPATITVSDADVAVNAEFAINRKDFGVNYAGMANDLIRDDVVLRLDLKSPRKK
ncbi:MAG: YceI family protein [Acidobacteria bacterium]|nr:YceI family protein [Acidobacteriota bacterium]